MAFAGNRAVGVLEGFQNRAREHGLALVRLNTHDRLGEAKRLWTRAGYREIPDYNPNPRANRRFQKLLG